MDGLPVGNTECTSKGKNFFFVFYFVDRVIIACIRTENVLFLIFFVQRKLLFWFGRVHWGLIFKVIVPLHLNIKWNKQNNELIQFMFNFK